MSDPSRNEHGKASDKLAIELAVGAAVASLLTGAAGVIATLASEEPAMGAAAVLVGAAGLGAWSYSRVRSALGSLGALRALADEISRGGSIRHLSPNELGSLGALRNGFNGVVDALANVAREVLANVHRVQGLPERLTDTISEIQSSSESQEEAVEETASLMANINTSIAGISERMEGLARAADEASSATLEMGSSVDEVARNAGSLHESVENSTSSVHEMSASIRQVAAGAEQVQRMAEESASSMLEMDRTVQDVAGHVQEASSLSARVNEGAEQGSQAVAATIDDIERIHLRTNDAKERLEQLVSRIGEIAQILGVIGDINDEANLLSLNAAIIAAQAGEQGKAFLVVANHVKTLAQRTAASTTDIESLLQVVRGESDSAVEAMESGIEAIDQGVGRSRAAGTALDTIRDSARESMRRVSEIARATEEQGRNSNLVARAAQETSVQIQQISQAMGEQTRAADQMLQNSEAALHACRHVHRSTEEQRETGRYINESISSITEMIRLARENVETHHLASESVSDAVTRLLENAQKSGQQIPEVHEMVRLLKDHSESIMTELARLEITSDF